MIKREFIQHDFKEKLPAELHDSCVIYIFLVQKESSLMNNQCSLKVKFKEDKAKSGE